MRANKKTARTKNRTTQTARKTRSKRSGVRATASRRSRATGVIKAKATATAPVTARQLAASSWPAKSYSVYNGLVLALGIAVLSVLSGIVIYFGSYDRADAIPHSRE